MVYFYPRSPRGERPLYRPERTTGQQNFYPRSPRGERPSSVACEIEFLSYFYPRSPRGERLAAQFYRAAGRAISIHAPRVGSDSGNPRIGNGGDISIHAPRVGSDQTRD